jgi:hypothetical protein
MKALYNLYNGKGLSIIGISGDNNLKYWTEAIKKDSIPWINISDLQGWHKKAFMIYGVKILPTLLLLDNKGIIIDNEFGQKNVESELEKLF